MFVRELPEMTGMLFVYDDAGMRSMWMKNTYIPLDIVFARADGTVSSVIHNTEPLSLRSLERHRAGAVRAGTQRRRRTRATTSAAGSQLIWTPLTD